MLVAAGQFSAGTDKDANLDTIAALAGRAAGAGARLVVFPEYAMFAVPKLDERVAAVAEPLDGPFATRLAGIAERLSVALVAGLVERVPGERRYANTLLAVGPDGNRLATYRKLHLYDAFGFTESDWVLPGEPADPPAVFGLDGLTVGAMTCYDLRFPELARRLVDAGADLHVVPAQWVPGPLKEDHWRTLARARAIENTSYLLAAGQCAPTGAGNSMLVDPMGVVLAGLGEAPGVALGEVEPDRIAAARHRNPSLEHRRFRVEPAD